MMPRHGSLCSGYGGLDMAVQAVFGGTTAWHCQYDPDDKHQHAAQILAHHWPHVPNHGDITAIDFTQVEPIDILTAGFPCQDVSLAGLRAGIAESTRSGLWRHVARAISELRPRLVVIENVRGLLSAKADGNVEPCAGCVGDRGGQSPLRALGAVLGDLAGLGFDAEWAVVRASEVGAPHQRERVFLLAWPADPASSGRPGEGLRGRAAERRPATADADGIGGERDRAHGGRRHEPAAHHLAAADSASVGEREPADEAHAVTGGRDSREVQGGRNAVRQRLRDHTDGRDDTPADAPGDRRHEGRAESARVEGRPDAALGGEPHVQWGKYEPAVRRWEHVLGRPAPRPTDALGRLAPPFVEWMQGLPAGHVTGVPGLTRGAQLKALGNGVVPQQAEAALRLLLARLELEEVVA